MDDRSPLPPKKSVYVSGQVLFENGQSGWRGGHVVPQVHARPEDCGSLPVVADAISAAARGIGPPRWQYPASPPSGRPLKKPANEISQGPPVAALTGRCNNIELVQPLVRLFSRPGKVGSGGILSRTWRPNQWLAFTDPI